MIIAHIHMIHLLPVRLHNLTEVYMYILKLKKERGNDSYYKSMIGGMIAEITSELKDAKQFTSAGDAKIILQKYKIYLPDFEVVKVA